MCDVLCNMVNKFLALICFLPQCAMVTCQCMLCGCGMVPSFVDMVKKQIFAERPDSTATTFWGHPDVKANASFAAVRAQCQEAVNAANLTECRATGTTQINPDGMQYEGGFSFEPADKVSR